ncbi:hypothetical protein NMY22_g3425 [Coprinellus aureogranulatus]|nr:hypothetical protein NMY22_g3425 [Coprinellus aureogranulatus]
MSNNQRETESPGEPQPHLNHALELASSLLKYVQQLTEVEETNRFDPLSYADAIKLQIMLAIVSRDLRYIANVAKPGGVNRLPNTILAKIFQDLVDLPMNNSSESLLYSPPSLRWLAITHVCTHWRKVARSTPALWTHILLHAKGGADLVDAFISNSGDLPLTVTLGRSGRSIASIPRIQAYRRDLRRVVNAVPHRITRLIVEPGFPIDDVLRADRLGQKLTAELSQALPTFLRGVAATSTASPSSSIGDSLSMLFRSPSAQLRCLELCGGPVISQMLDPGTSFQHLKVLQLIQSDPRGETTGPLPLTKLLTMTANLKSSLQRLILVGLAFSTDLSNTPQPEPQRILLESLDYLEVGAWQSNEMVARFLSHIDIPSTTASCIWGDELEEVSSRGFHPFFRQHPGNVHSIVLGSVPGGNMIGLRDGVLFINGAIPFPMFSSMFAEKVMSVEKLVLVPLINPPSLPEWCRLFELLPDIRIIEVRDADPGRLLRALRLKPGLPRLAELDLRYSDRRWSEAEFDPLGVRYATEPPSVAALLCSVASHRDSQALADTIPQTRRLERVYVRFDSRVIEVPDWEPELEAIFDRMREHVGNVLYFKHKWGLWDAATEEAERKKEIENGWYLVTRLFEGVWPTKAAFFSHLAGAIQGDE